MKVKINTQKQKNKKQKWLITCSADNRVYGHRVIGTQEAVRAFIIRLIEEDIRISDDNVISRPKTEKDLFCLDGRIWGHVKWEDSKANYEAVEEPKYIRLR